MGFEFPTSEDYKTAAKIGVSSKNVDQRVLVYGWSIKRAVSTPLRYRKSKLKYVELLAESNGISKSTYFKRVREGMDILEAATIPVCKYKEYQELREENGISLDTFYQRVRRGMNPYEAATKPLQQKGRKIQLETEYRTGQNEEITKTVGKEKSKYGKLIEIASENGIGYKTFYSRIRYGFDPIEAAMKPLSKKGRKKKQIS